MKQEHTKGEWVRGTNTNSNDWMKIYCNGKAIARSLELSKVGNRQSTDFEEEEANAAHIVKCVNAHQELVHCCNTILSNLQTNKKFGNSLTQQEMDAAINILTIALKNEIQPAYQ